MKRIKRIFALALACWLLLSVPVCAHAAEQAAWLPSGQSRDALGDAIESYVAEHEDTTAGMAVAVFDARQTIYQNWFGYANKETELPVNADTVMEWGSVTKLLVWVSVMQLWERGLLDLDADIRDYLPEGFLAKLRYDTPVTMLNLMNHNAGFEEIYFGMMTGMEDRILPLEVYLQEIQPQQIFEPGAVTAYSNWGVALAGYLVERISGMEFHAYVREHIFEPLGMTHSALNADLSDNPWVRQQWETLERYTDTGDRIDNCKHFIVMYPAGMCTSTLADFQAFAMALLDRESPLFADPGTYDEMMTPSSYFGDTGRGLNFHGIWAESYYSVPVIGHGGNTMGCSSQLLLDLENGIGMTVMTNQSGETVYCNQMPELVFGKYDGEPLDFSGYAAVARTCYRGPLKLQQVIGGLYHITPEWSKGAFTSISQSGELTKITTPGGGGDFLIKTVPQMVTMFLPPVLWAVFLVFSLGYFLVPPVMGLIGKLRGKFRTNPLKKWTMVSGIAQVIPLIPVVFAVMSLTGGNQWSLWLYRLTFAAFWGFAAAFCALAVYGLRRIRQEHIKNPTSIIMVISLMVSVFSILYWELGCFWRI